MKRICTYVAARNLELSNCTSDLLLEGLSKAMQWYVVFQWARILSSIHFSTRVCFLFFKLKPSLPDKAIIPGASTWRCCNPQMEGQLSTCLHFLLNGVGSLRRSYQISTDSASGRSQRGETPFFYSTCLT